jgi:hypothetical protein
MHLYVDISGHGFGHLAQTAPVLNALRERLPQLRLTLRCALPRDRLSRRVRGEFTHIATASDFGLIMKSALDVDLPATLAAYQEWHKDWEALVEREARRLTELAPDGVLSNVSYLALAAAHRAGIPAIGLGSLHWAAICAAYFRDEPAFRPIHDQMLAAYGSADAFLRLTPGMAMTDLPRVIDVGPVAEARRTQRAALPPAGWCWWPWVASACASPPAGRALPASIGFCPAPRALSGTTSPPSRKPAFP